MEQTIEPVRVHTNLWETHKAWGGILGAALVICIVVVLVCLKHDKCIIAKALSKRNGERARPEKGIETIPLRDRSEDTPNKVVDVEKPQEVLNPRYDLCPKV